MDLSLLATLKDKLVHAKDLADILDYFLTHFATDREFIAQGEPTRSIFLEAIVKEIGKELFRKDVDVTGLLLTRLPDHQFIHSGGMIEGKLITLLYFEDLQMGFMAIIWSERTNETKMVRFSGKRLASRPEPSQN